MAYVSSVVDGKLEQLNQQVIAAAYKEMLFQRFPIGAFRT